MVLKMEVYLVEILNQLLMPSLFMLRWGASKICCCILLRSLEKRKEGCARVTTSDEALIELFYLVVSILLESAEVTVAQDVAEN